jgi:T5SS/PEP-CTERM-associated repeat protein
MPTGYQYVWTGDISTSFDLAGNWENLQTGTTATSVPGVDDSAAITAQGLITGTSSVYTLSITGTGTGLSIGGQIDGQFTSLLGNITVDAGDSLSADVNTSVQQGALLTVGAGAAATVKLDAGAHLLSNWNGAQGVDMVIGQSNGSGTVNASGAGALVSSGEDGIQIGAGGQGLIAIGAGASITAGTGAPTNWIGAAIGLPGGSGTLSITGTGATGVFGDIVSVGFGGSGTLQVTAGASLTAGDGVHSLTIGDLDGADAGTGNVSILNASATLHGLIAVGAYGDGTLTIGGLTDFTQTLTEGNGTASDWSVLVGETSATNGDLIVGLGASVTLAAGIGVGADGTGTLTLAYGDITVNAPQGEGLVGLELGLEAGSAGDVNIQNGTFDDAGQAGVLVGGAGAGTLTLFSAGTLLTGGTSSAAALAIGDATTSTGTVSVTGSGTVLNCAGQLLVGNQGDGSLSVSTNATLIAGSSATAAGLVVGASTGAGTVSLAGEVHATITGQIGIGAYGSGSLTVAGGSTLTATASGAPALELGDNSGSSGTALITDAGTKVTLNGGLTVGGYGNGTLTVQDGALVSCSSTTTALPGFAIAAGPGTSTVLITGAKTTLLDSGQFIVGGLGSGALTISAGAVVDVSLPAGQSIPAAVIAADAGATASSVGVSGTGSAWAITGELLVGHAADGLLSITAGGQVSASTVLVSDEPGGNGTINVNGTGSALTAGTLSLGVNGNKAATLTIAAGGNVTVAGTASIYGNATISDGSLTAGALVDLGKIALTGGTLTCLGGMSGNGTLSLGGGADLVLDGARAATVHLALTSGGATLTADDTKDLAGVINGWSKGDVLDLTGIVATKDSYANHMLKLYDGKTLLGSLTFGGKLTAANFTLAPDGHGGSLISFHS